MGVMDWILLALIGGYCAWLLLRKKKGSVCGGCCGDCRACSGCRK